MLLSFDKPMKLRPSHEHASIYSSDCGVAGTFVPNMSPEDEARWKAKIRKKGTPEAFVEIRKSLRGTQLLVIVGKNGWVYKSEHQAPGGRADSGYKQDVRDLNVRISVNGPLAMTFDDWSELQRAVKEARAVLDGEITV